MSVEELKKIASKYEGRVTKLFSIGRRGLTKGEKISYVKEFGFTKEDIPQLLVLAQDKDIYDFDYSDIEEDEGLEFFGVIHAWYALSEMKVPEFRDILIEMIEEIDDDYFDDWVFEEFRELIKPYRKDMYQFFAESIVSGEKNTWILVCYVEAIEDMLKNDEVSLERVEELIVEMLKHGKDKIVNAFILGICIDYKLTKYHELIKDSFERDAIDIEHFGDLEDVEILLGLREKRETERKLNRFQEMLLGLYDKEEYGKPYIREEPKVGRNEPCPCGSGKKYKKCCMNK